MRAKFLFILPAFLALPAMARSSPSAPHRAHHGHPDFGQHVCRYYTRAGHVFLGQIYQSRRRELKLEYAFGKASNPAQDEPGMPEPTATLAQAALASEIANDLSPEGPLCDELHSNDAIAEIDGILDMEARFEAKGAHLQVAENGRTIALPNDDQYWLSSDVRLSVDKGETSIGSGGVPLMDSDSDAGTNSAGAIP